MSKNYRKAFENLDLFLADTEGQSPEEVAKELNAQGVDVDTFLSNVKGIVRKGFQQQVKAAADSEREAATQKKRGRFGDLATKTKDEMLTLIAAIQSGAFGASFGRAAMARFRNQDNAQLSEEDLRSWLEDIDASDPESHNE